MPAREIASAQAARSARSASRPNPADPITNPSKKQATITAKE
jgi:hypothetical protein